MALDWWVKATLIWKKVPKLSSLNCLDAQGQPGVTGLAMLPIGAGVHITLHVAMVC